MGVVYAGIGSRAPAFLNINNVNGAYWWDPVDYVRETFFYIYFHASYIGLSNFGRCLSEILWTGQEKRLLMSEFVVTDE